MKEYSIVPVSNEFGKVAAEDGVSALEKFADGMDSDMGAYFKAVEEVESLHQYDRPQNFFEASINTMIYNMKVKKEHPERFTGARSETKMSCLRGLQKYYDEVMSVANSSSAPEITIETLDKAFEALIIGVNSLKV